MDVRCRHCGEPMDPEHFHEGSDGTYAQWFELFKLRGCGAVKALFDGDSVHSPTVACCSKEPSVDAESLDAIESLQDMMGDDYDGLAAIEEDYFFAKSIGGELLWHG